MAFRYQHNGEERVAQDVAELERALRAGEIEKTTLVTDDTVGARLQAGAVIAMNRRSAAPPPTPAAKAPAPVKKPKEKEVVPKRVRNHQLIATGLGVAAVFVLSSFDIPPYLTGEIAGRSVVILLIVLVLWGAIFGKKSDGQKIRLAWVGFFTWSVLILGQAWIIGEARARRLEADKAAIKTMVEGTRKSAAEMEAMIKDPQGKGEPASPAAPSPPSTTEPANPVSPGGASLLAKIAPIAASTQAASIKEMREWQALESTIGLETALAPATLASPEGRKRNKQIFDRYLAEFEAHLKRLEALLTRHREQLLALVENDPGKVAFTQGVDTSLAQTRLGYEETRKNQRDAIAAMHALNDFMSSRGGTVTLQRDQLVFAGQADVDTYTKLVARILDLGKEEEAITKKQLDRVKSSADRIEKMTPK